jgi:SAM-dependent methyltransferase
MEGRDMIPGKYLGGLKIWSCTTDLVRCVDLLAHHGAGAAPRRCGDDTVDAVAAGMFRADALVAEFGCGHGLPGIAAVACGARDVTFHDFNEEVLDAATKPNIALSAHAATAPPTQTPVVRFASGAWADFAPIFSGDDALLLDAGVAARRAEGAPLLYDVIMGSDVTYDREACVEVLTAASRLLVPGGHLVLGTKLYYFGTGGGRHDVLELLASDVFAGTLAVALDGGDAEALTEEARAFVAGCLGDGAAEQGMSRTMMVLRRL